MYQKKVIIQFCWSFSSLSLPIKMTCFLFLCLKNWYVNMKHHLLELLWFVLHLKISYNTRCEWLGLHAGSVNVCIRFSRHHENDFKRRCLCSSVSVHERYGLGVNGMFWNFNSVYILRQMYVFIETGPSKAFPPFSHKVAISEVWFGYDSNDL